MKKVLTLLLCAAMLCSLCACGGTAEAVALTTGTETAEESSAMLGTEDAQILLSALTEKYDADAVVLKSGEVEVPWGVYYSIIANNLSSFVYYYGGLPTDYTSVMASGETMDAVLLESAESYACRIAAIRRESPLSKEERDEAYESYWNALLSQTGDEETLLAQLAAAGYTTSTFRFVNEANIDIERVFTDLYGAAGEKITAEQAEKWCADNGYVRTKHILLMTDDETLTEEDKAEKKQQLEDIRTGLLAIEDSGEREAAFDEKMNALSEDTGLAMYPDGYVYQSGTMVPEFEEAAFALEAYALSEVVETDYGYHLLMALPVESDSVMEYDSSYMPVTVADTVANEDFSARLAQWAGEMEVHYTPEFEGFTIQSLFEGYQERIDSYAALLAGDGMGSDGKLHIYPYGACEVADTSDSTFIDAARYYESGHLILTIQGREEAFVNVPAAVWEQFKASEVKGTYYKKYLKGNALYKVSGVPAGKDIVTVIEE